MRVNCVTEPGIFFQLHRSNCQSQWTDYFIFSWICCTYAASCFNDYFRINQMHCVLWFSVQISRRFEAIAIGVLGKCYEKSHEKTYRILHSQCPQIFGLQKISLLQVMSYSHYLRHIESPFDILNEKSNRYPIFSPPLQSELMMCLSISTVGLSWKVPDVLAPSRIPGFHQSGLARSFAFHHN